VLGLSTGGDIAIDIAARRDDVKAVVADGVAQIGYQDAKEYTDDPAQLAGTYVMFKAIEILQGRSGPKASLADQIARSTAPHLIVSAGKLEKEWGELYDRAGGAHSELWYLPKASHTGALKQYPAAYEQRVVSFLDASLAGS
jgi:pimeloyl-ACP methyl ester carboxylesterase